MVGWYSTRAAKRRRKLSLVALSSLAAIWLLASCGDVALDPIPEEIGKHTERGALAVDAAPLNYIVIGDWGQRGKFYQRNVAEAMGITGALEAIRFVISAGDNFYDDGVKNVLDSHWKESFEEIYTHPSLQVPWYVTLGNHDYKGDVSAQVAYTHFSKRWTLPDLYYDRVERIDDATEVHFVFLDTNTIHRKKAAGDEQLAWLDRTLAAIDAEWTIVVGHHPIYSGGAHGENRTLVRKLKPLLEKHHVDAYFSGHDHDLQHLHDGDIHYFVSGAAAQVRKDGRHRHTQFTITRPGFLAMSMTANDLDATFIDHQGNVLYTTRIPQRTTHIIK